MLGAAAALAVGAVVGYFVIGGGDGTTADDGIVVDFAEHGVEQVRMCPSDKEVSEERFTVDVDVPGFDTPQAAVDDYLATVRADADLSPLEGNVEPAILAEMRELRAPARELTLTATDVDADHAVFDKVSKTSGVLDVRVLVEAHPAGGYNVEAAYVCPSALNTDAERFRELIRQAAGDEPEPLLEPAPETEKSEEER